MEQIKSMLSTLPPELLTFLSTPMYVIGVLLGVGVVVLLLKYLVYDLPKSRRESEDSGERPASVIQKSYRRRKDDTPVPNDEDARVAAAIAASIVAMEDRAVVAAITAAVRVYLEAENGGAPLQSGFRVVSFKRRSGGAWNRK